ncbi:MAG: HPr family phosphocarrier protein [Lachnospiraceae bacterium]|nr:HPr family phosphocarrier protein [Lachnospiraceae bacterium]
MVAKTLIVNIPGEVERNAALLVQNASAFDARIHLVFKNKTVNAKSIMGVMTLPMSDGDEIEVRADGTDEEDALAAVVNFLNP